MRKIALTLSTSLLVLTLPAFAQDTATTAPEAPATDAPATDAPATDAPAAEAPAADAPATEAPAAEAPAATAESGDAAASGEDAHGGEAAGAGGHAAEAHIEDVSFPWEGPFGSFDQMQLQRGLQVYTEVCSNCHGLQYVPIRTLGDEGGPALPEDQVRAYATRFDVFDAELDDTRPGLPSDHFPKGSLPNAPDLSLMAKARAGFHGPYGLGYNQFVQGIGGPEYIHAILTSYTGEEKEEAGTTLYANTAFPGGWIAMPPPLSDEAVVFEPEHANSLDDLSMDVSAFLTWAAEPKMMARKHAGFVAVFFLAILSVLLFLTNKRLWAPYKGKKVASSRS